MPCWGWAVIFRFPVLSAAALRRIPTLIHEQNAVPGLANRLLARWVDSVAISFSGTEHYFPKQKVWLSGLPVRLGVQPAEPAAARAALGFKKDVFTFFAFGGSLGAHRLNEVLFDVWKRLLAAGRRFQVLHVTGPRDFPLFEPLFQESENSRADYCPIAMTCRWPMRRRILSWRAPELQRLRSYPPSSVRPFSFPIRMPQTITNGSMRKCWSNAAPRRRYAKTNSRPNL